jgi:MFS transporter, Spinster family, sphingosine-1-phosphate transporter
MGVVVGGKVGDYLGGYQGKHALLFCLGLALCAVLIAMPVVFVDNFWLLFVLLWLDFFVGGAMLPTLTGLMISSIPTKMRNIGSSVA